MICGDLILDLTTRLARITQGAGSTALTVVAKVFVPSAKLAVHLSIFPRDPQNATRTPGPSAVWDLVPAWPPSPKGGGQIPLRSVFDGAQALPDGYEISGSAVKLWIVTATLSITVATTGNGEYVLGATFEPNQPMSAEERAYWFAACKVSCDGADGNTVNGNGE